MESEQVGAAELFANHERALITLSRAGVVACFLIEDCQIDERPYRIGMVGAVDLFRIRCARSRSTIAPASSWSVISNPPSLISAVATKT